MKKVMIFLLSIFSLSFGAMSNKEIDEKINELKKEIKALELDEDYEIKIAGEYFYLDKEENKDFNVRYFLHANTYEPLIIVRYPDKNIKNIELVYGIVRRTEIPTKIITDYNGEAFASNSFYTKYIETKMKLFENVLQVYYYTDKKITIKYENFKNVDSNMETLKFEKKMKLEKKIDELKGMMK